MVSALNYVALFLASVAGVILIGPKKLHVRIFLGLSIIAMLIFAMFSRSFAGFPRLKLASWFRQLWPWDGDPRMKLMVVLMAVAGYILLSQNLVQVSEDDDLDDYESIFSQFDDSASVSDSRSSDHEPAQDGLPKRSAKEFSDPVLGGRHDGHKVYTDYSSDGSDEIKPPKKRERSPLNVCHCPQEQDEMGTVEMKKKRRTVESPHKFYLLPEQNQRRLNWATIPERPSWQATVSSRSHPQRTFCSRDCMQGDNASHGLCPHCKCCNRFCGQPASFTHNFQGSPRVIQSPHIQTRQFNRGCTCQGRRNSFSYGMYQDVDVASSRTEQEFNRSVCSQKSTEILDPQRFFAGYGMKKDYKTLILLFDILAIANLLVAMTHWFANYDVKPSYLGLTVAAFVFIFISAFNDKIRKKLLKFNRSLTSNSTKHKSPRELRNKR